MAHLPPRSSRLDSTPMLLSFDLDCGELVPGHRFIARGLSDDGRVEVVGVSAPAISLEYELVPGVPPTDESLPFNYLVGIEYEVDGPLPWEPVDGGTIAPFEGGVSTHGSRGSWPLPEGTARIRLRLSSPNRRRRDGGLDRGCVAGVIDVDLVARRAEWTPEKN